MIESREKLLKGIQECDLNGGLIGNCPYKGILALLKEQEPVKPNLDVDEWMCGNCGHKLEHQELLGYKMLFYEQYNYCPNCGRKVKWE